MRETYQNKNCKNVTLPKYHSVNSEIYTSFLSYLLVHTTTSSSCKGLLAHSHIKVASWKCSTIYFKTTRRFGGLLVAPAFGIRMGGDHFLTFFYLDAPCRVSMAPPLNICQKILLLGVVWKKFWKAKFGKFGATLLLGPFKSGHSLWVKNIITFLPRCDWEEGRTTFS